MAKRIIVADDEQSMRETLEIMLEKEGFDVDSAANGIDALRLFEEKGCDLLITDLKMPDMGGIELIKALYDMGADVPIIVMTAFATKEQAIDALNLGASFFIEKPFQKQ
ncbi:MAG: response regulator, partial [Candidatus Latescibacteria bacterium]|nr:response regulator [Candidatus Latescibacterota bacterium]